MKSRLFFTFLSPDLDKILEDKTCATTLTMTLQTFLPIHFIEGLGLDLKKMNIGLLFNLNSHTNADSDSAPRLLKKPRVQRKEQLCHSYSGSLNNLLFVLIVGLSIIDVGNCIQEKTNKIR